MSRDQKPGRSENIASAPVRVAVPEAAMAHAPTNPTPAGRPVLLLASLFLLASTLGGVGVALAERFIR